MNRNGPGAMPRELRGESRESIVEVINKGNFPIRGSKATEKTYEKSIGWFQTNLFHTVIYRHSIEIYPAQFEMVIFL